MAFAQVHRFRELVAVFVGSGETRYLKPKEARKLARALNAAAKSVERESFADSTCGTVSFEFDGNRHQLEPGDEQ
jgi:hypothetical protein